MQAPVVNNVIAVPETVHTPVVAEVNATVKPDVAVAESAGGVAEISKSAGTVNEIDCAPWATTILLALEVDDWVNDAESPL